MFFFLKKIVVCLNLKTPMLSSTTLVPQVALPVGPVQNLLSVSLHLCPVSVFLLAVFSQWYITGWERENRIEHKLLNMNEELCKIHIPELRGLIIFIEWVPWPCIFKWSVCVGRWGVIGAKSVMLHVVLKSGFAEAKEPWSHLKGWGTCRGVSSIQFSEAFSWSVQLHLCCLGNDPS